MQHQQPCLPLSLLVLSRMAFQCCRIPPTSTSAGMHSLLQAHLRRYEAEPEKGLQLSMQLPSAVALLSQRIWLVLMSCSSTSDPVTLAHQDDEVKLDGVAVPHAVALSSGTAVLALLAYAHELYINRVFCYPGAPGW